MADSVFSLSKKDLMFGVTYDPAWYRVRIDNYFNEPSKNLEKPSTNHWYEGTIICNADNGDTKYAEHPVKFLFNSKAMGNAKGFLIGLGVPEESITENARFDFNSAKGKEIEMFIGNKLYEGRQVNEYPHKYRLPRTA